MTARSKDLLVAQVYPSLALSRGFLNPPIHLDIHSLSKSRRINLRSCRSSTLFKGTDVTIQPPLLVPLASVAICATRAGLPLYSGAR